MNSYANLLALNVDKTTFVIFERRHDILLSDQYVVRYGNEIVRRVNSVIASRLQDQFLWSDMPH
jgi:hypothetical protein